LSYFWGIIIFEIGGKNNKQVKDFPNSFVVADDIEIGLSKYVKRKAMIKQITKNRWDIDRLKGKKATFMLSLSNTQTADIPGITQAGIPGVIYLTPTLDGEFVATGQIFSLKEIAKTPTGVPTPALITRAIYLLNPFETVEFLNLGLKVEPKVPNTIYHFDIDPSGRIDEGANIDAKDVFEKGFKFAKEYILDGEYLILAESVPSGTTTATTTALALGYDAEKFFSSSFKKVPNSIRKTTIEKSLSNIKKDDTIFDRLSKVSDNMLIFNAGFILGCRGRFDVVLAGGTQMAGVLLVANSLARELGIELELNNCALCTTKWVANDKNSDIKALLKMLDFKVDSYYADFDFEYSNHPALKLYDEGEAKEGVGAGGALVYGLLNGLSKESITKKIESFLR